MFKQLKLVTVTVAFLAVVAGSFVGAVIPATSAGAAAPSAPDCSGNGFLGIPAWYKGLARPNASGNGCDISGPANSKAGFTEFVWRIALNIVEIILRFVSYIAVIFIIYGGFLYLTSAGNADNVARALKTIINASIGFAIALCAVTVKNFVWDQLIAPGTSAGNNYGLTEKSAGELLVAGLNMAYFIAGAVAVVMIVVAGLNYVTSSGDPGKTAKAKNTILYAVIGIVVIVFAFAITTFISSNLK